MDDLSAEILQEMAAFLLCVRLPEGHPQRHLGVCVSDAPEIRRSLQGKHIMVMSACSKRMRWTLFAYNMLRNLTIYACARDIEIIKEFSAEARSCVK